MNDQALTAPVLTLDGPAGRTTGEDAGRVRIEPRREIPLSWRGSATVHGKAQGMGSKRIGRIAGRPVILDNKDAALRTFQESLCCEMLRDRPETPINAAVAVAVRIYVARPASHYGKAGLKPSAPALPASGAFHDADKVARSIGDCMTSVRWIVDDKRITDWVITRRYADDGPERVEVEAWEVRLPVVNHAEPKREEGGRE